MSSIEVSRVDGVYPMQRVVDTFKAHGLLVLKGYLPAGTRDRLRSSLERALETARLAGAAITLREYPHADFLLGDILSIRALEEVDYIFFRPDLLDTARALLRSEQLLYWGDSSVQFGEGARGFHKDNVERNDATHEDWIGDYGLIRCGFYLQDHVRHSGGLKVRLGSHNVASHRIGPMRDVCSSYGDLVVWSMRLTHSGNNRRLHGLSGMSLHPRIEAIAPSWLTLPPQLRRISAFCAFGRPGPHTDSYIRKMIARDADYRPYFQRARKPGETLEILERYGVSFFKPNDYYGELDAAGT